MAAEQESPKRGQPRRVVFVGGAKKEMEEVPVGIRKRFLVAIEQLSWGLSPGETVRQLSAVGNGVAEVKINGHPAYRLVFTTQVKGKVLVLAVRAKTSNGTDRTLIEVARKRLKAGK